MGVFLGFENFEGLAFFLLFVGTCCKVIPSHLSWWSPSEDEMHWLSFPLVFTQTHTNIINECAKTSTEQKVIYLLFKLIPLNIFKLLTTYDDYDFKSFLFCGPLFIFIVSLFIFVFNLRRRHISSLMLNLQNILIILILSFWIYILLPFFCF